ncbi:uncharacterized protein LOC127264614 [Andrographis paniculata]|uniref:uncharacterized protein LOC127264614 n=1 Tax=Andrographis paniculata TaxID=175694 RepID=UPI0021E74BCB|nr:uncharacterized protein LOC127264614 [Andrographis paniculata]
MLVANSFDLWQKDVFFSAAEEVQQSADIMESTYRRWLSARREGVMPQHLDELGGQLQMAFGTAKWQLDEFEKAVQMSYRGRVDDITVSRHRQFVSAIEEQISEVEIALKEAFETAGKRPFRWVHLDEQECDDLAHFLSGTSGISCKPSFNQNKNTEEVRSKIQKDQQNCLEEVVASNEDTKPLMEQEQRILPEIGDEIICETDCLTSNSGAWNSADTYLEIVIDKDERKKNSLIEATPKEKGSKPPFWRAKGVSNYPQMKFITSINQFLIGHKNQRQQHMSPAVQVKSIRFILALMLTIFFVVPFLVYST